MNMMILHRVRRNYKEREQKIGLELEIKKEEKSFFQKFLTKTKWFIGIISGSTAVILLATIILLHLVALAVLGMLILVQ